MGEHRTALILSLVLLFAISALPLVSASDDSWTTMEPMPTARSGLGVAVVDSKIFAIGGEKANIIGCLDVNEMYDPTTNTWVTKMPIPSPRTNFGIAVVQNKIYVIGGYTSGNVFTGINQVYDPSTDSWENRTSMPTPRVGIDANVVEDKIYVIGGAPSIGDTTNVNEVYDPQTDKWTTKTPIPNPVTAYASAVVDNKIYVIGGARINLTQIYDPITDSWSYGASIPTKVSGAGVGVTTGTLAPKKIYVIGGSLSKRPTNLNQVYDPENDTWNTAEVMPTKRLWLGVAVVDDVMYALGGATTFQDILGAPFQLNEQYIPVGYIPEFPSWTPLLIMLVAVIAVAVVYRCKLSKHNGARRG